MVLETQPPHTIVILLFTGTHQNNKLTMLWKSPDYHQPWEVAQKTFSNHLIDKLCEMMFVFIGILRQGGLKDRNGSNSRPDIIS